MIDAATMLSLLQYGDSAFPAGGFAFSWGIEGLAADGLLDGKADLEQVIDGQLRLRWNLMDRRLLRRSHAAADLDGVAAVDRLAEAATPSAEIRAGSHRAGRALLGISARLGHPLSAEYRRLADADHRLGHLAVAQGLVYREVGLAVEAAELLSGWTLIAGLVSAAIRLAVIGHVEGQHLMQRSRTSLADLLLRAPSLEAPLSSFTPQIDIAVSRNPARHTRMFAT